MFNAESSGDWTPSSLVVFLYLSASSIRWCGLTCDCFYFCFLWFYLLFDFFILSLSSVLPQRKAMLLKHNFCIHLCVLQGPQMLSWIPL